MLHVQPAPGDVTLCKDRDPPPHSYRREQETPRLQGRNQAKSADLRDPLEAPPPFCTSASMGEATQ